MLGYRIRLHHKNKNNQSKNSQTHTQSFSESSHAVINSDFPSSPLAFEYWWLQIDFSFMVYGDCQQVPRLYPSSSSSHTLELAFLEEVLRFFSSWVDLPTVHSLRYHCIQDSEILVQATHSVPPVLQSTWSLTSKSVLLGRRKEKWRLQK